VAPPPTEIKVATPEVVQPPSATPAARKWQKDGLGVALVALGGAAIVAGVAVAGASVATESTLNHELDPNNPMRTFPDYLDAYNQTQAMRIAGPVVLGAGAVLVLGGIVRFVLVHKSSVRAQRPQRLALGHNR
jgi:hypothetical protein